MGEWESINETLDVLSDPEALKDIRELGEPLSALLPERRARSVTMVLGDWRVEVTKGRAVGDAAVRVEDGIVLLHVDDPRLAAGHHG